MNRPIPTLVHGALDVAGALLLLAAPRLLNFGPNTTTYLTVVAVAVAIVTMLTRWEVSLAKVLPTKTHLAIDLATGLLTALSPFLFLRDAGETGRIFLIAFGIFEIGAALLTKTVSPVEGGTSRAV
jgi:hypothetical protein